MGEWMGEWRRLTVTGHESAWDLECRFPAVCVEPGNILIISDLIVNTRRTEGS